MEVTFKIRIKDKNLKGEQVDTYKIINLIDEFLMRVWGIERIDYETKEKKD